MSTDSNRQHISEMLAARALRTIIAYTDFETMWDKEADEWRQRLTESIADELRQELALQELLTAPDPDTIEPAELVRGSAVLAAIQYAATRDGMSIGDVLYAAGRIETFMNRDHG